MNQGNPADIVPSDNPAIVRDKLLPSSPSPMLALPTLPRNALRKILERPSFTPEEVAKLGYQRLEQAEGIGQKSLDIILAWLRKYGYELQPPPAPPIFSGSLRAQKRMKKNIDFALRILRANGYTVCLPDARLSRGSTDSPESN